MENDFGLSEEMAKSSCDFDLPLLEMKMSVKDLALLCCIFGKGYGVWEVGLYDGLTLSEIKKLANNAVERSMNEMKVFKNAQGTVHIEINDRYELKAWVENGNSEN